MAASAKCPFDATPFPFSCFVWTLSWRTCSLLSVGPGEHDGNEGREDGVDGIREEALERLVSCLSGRQLQEMDLRSQW